MAVGYAIGSGHLLLAFTCTRQAWLLGRYYLSIWELLFLTLEITHLTQRASLVAQMVKNLPAVQETWVRFLGWEDLLEKGMATHSRILTWRIPRTEEPGGLQSMGSQRVGHDWVTNTITAHTKERIRSECGRVNPEIGSSRNRWGLGKEMAHLLGATIELSQGLQLPPVIPYWIILPLLASSHTLPHLLTPLMMLPHVSS